MINQKNKTNDIDKTPKKKLFAKDEPINLKSQDSTMTKASDYDR